MTNSLYQKKDSKILNFIKGSLVLSIANIALRSLSFFLLPLYTGRLTPEEMGISDLASTLTLLVFPILQLGLDSAFSAFFYDRKDEEHQKTVFNTVWLTVFVTSLIPLIACFFAEEISQSFLKTPEHASIIVVALISVTIHLWFMPYPLWLRMKNHMTSFALINFISSFVAILSNIIFVVHLKLGAMSLVAGTLVSNIVQLLLYFGFSKVKINPKYSDHNLRKKMLQFSIPLIPLSIATWFISLADRRIILDFLGEAQVGIYSIATRFASVISIFSGAIYTAYTSFAFSKKGDADAKQQYARILNVIYFFTFGVSFTISLFGPEILDLMVDESYKSAYLALPGVLFGQVFYAVNTIVSYGINFAKKTVYLLMSTVISAVASVSLNLILTPRYGILATGLVNVISYFIMCVLNYFFAQRLYPVNYRIMRIMSTAFIGLAIVGIFVTKSFIIKLIVWIIIATLGFTIFSDAAQDIGKLILLAWNSLTQRFKKKDQKG